MNENTQSTLEQKASPQEWDAALERLAKEINEVAEQHAQAREESCGRG